MLHALVSVLFATSNTLIEKAYLNKRKIMIVAFVPLIFLLAFVIQAIFLYPIYGEIKEGAFAPWVLILFGIVVVLAAIRNMFFYQGFTKEKLSAIEPFAAFVPLLTVLIAAFAHPDEASFPILALALVAAIALVWAHIEKKHLVLHKGLIFIILAVLMEAAENNIADTMLDYYSPVAFYTIRVGLIALVLFAFYRPSLKKIKAKEFALLPFIALFWVLVSVFYYYSYQEIGIVYTSLIFMLTPFLIVFGSYAFLKDRKIKKKDVIALIIVVACVVVSLFFGR